MVVFWIGVLLGCGHGEEAKEPEAFDFGAAPAAAEPTAEPTAADPVVPASAEAPAAAAGPDAPVASPQAPAPDGKPAASGGSPKPAIPAAVVPSAAAAAAAPAVTTPAAAPAATVVAPVAPVVPAAPRSRTYPLDPKASGLQVLVKFDRESPMTSLGHDHIVAANGWTGKVRWGAAGDCSVEISVPVAKLVVDPPGSRKRFGLESETPEGDKAKITENFQGKRQLDMATYPQITFKSTSCPGTAGQVDVPGEFTMKGKTRPVTLSMKVALDGDKFRASGKLVVKGSDWGLEPFTAPAGVLRNEDKLSFYIDAQGVAVD